MNIYRKMWYHHGNLTLAFKTMAGCHVILTATGQEGNKYLIYSIIKSKVIHSKDKMDMGNSLLFYYKFIIIIITLFYGPHAPFCLMMQLVFFFKILLRFYWQRILYYYALLRFYESICYKSIYFQTIVVVPHFLRFRDKFMLH